MSRSTIWLPIAALVAAGAVAVLLVGTAYSAPSTPANSADTIAALTRKVNTLTIQVRFLKDDISMITTTGSPAQYPSLPKFWSDFLSLENKVLNMCRVNQLQCPY